MYLYLKCNKIFLRYVISFYCFECVLLYFIYWGLKLGFSGSCLDWSNGATMSSSVIRVTHFIGSPNMFSYILRKMVFCIWINLKLNCVSYTTTYPILLKIQPIRGLESRCIFCGIQRLVFHLDFPPLLASDYRNGTKTYVRTVLVNVVSFLHKVKIVLETWEVNKILMMNSMLGTN